MRKHRVALEHDAAIRSGFGGNGLSIEQDATLRRPLLTENQTQKGALAGPGRTDDREEGSGGDLEIDALEDDLIAIFDPDVAKGERAHQRASGS